MKPDDEPVSGTHHVPISVPFRPYWLLNLSSLTGSRPAAPGPDVPVARTSPPFATAPPTGPDRGTWCGG